MSDEHFQVRMALATGIDATDPDVLVSVPMTGRERRRLLELIDRSSPPADAKDLQFGETRHFVFDASVIRREIADLFTFGNRPHACMTGDCPHQAWAECVDAIRAEILQVDVKSIAGTDELETGELEMSDFERGLVAAMDSPWACRRRCGQCEGCIRLDRFRKRLETGP